MLIGLDELAVEGTRRGGRLAKLRQLALESIHYRPGAVQHLSQPDELGDCANILFPSPARLDLGRCHLQHTGGNAQVRAGLRGLAEVPGLLQPVSNGLDDVVGLRYLLPRNLVPGLEGKDARGHLLHAGDSLAQHTGCPAKPHGQDLQAGVHRRVGLGAAERIHALG